MEDFKNMITLSFIVCFTIMIIAYCYLMKFILNNKIYLRVLKSEKGYLLVRGILASKQYYYKNSEEWTLTSLYCYMNFEECKDLYNELKVMKNYELKKDTEKFEKVKL